MISPANHSTGQWRPGFRSAVADIAVTRMRRELKQHSINPADYTNVERLATLLQRVAEHVADINNAPVADFLAFTLEVLARSGGGSDFQLTAEVLDATDRIIDLLVSRDRPVSDLLLAQAGYYAVFANGSQRRRNAISRAVTLSRTIDERVRSLITLAQFEIDISRYPQARRIVEECAALVSDTPRAATYLPRIRLTEGMSYFYRDIDRAEAYFLRTIDEAVADSDHPQVRNAVSTAYHYLGRVANERGLYVEAIEKYVLAQQEPIISLSGTGFHHLRVAEILLNRANVVQALDHLNEAKRFFLQGQQFSTGEEQLDVAWAKYYFLIGDVDRAETLVIDALERARADPYPRGELLFLAQLVRIRISRKRILSAIWLAARVAYLLYRHESEGSFRLLFIQWRNGGTIARHLILRRGKRIDTRSPVHCPCPMHLS
jgi:tetratricopeptide (TPR) repeat protein